MWKEGKRDNADLVFGVCEPQGAADGAKEDEDTVPQHVPISCLISLKMERDIQEGRHVAVAMEGRGVGKGIHMAQEKSHNLAWPTSTSSRLLNSSTTAEKKLSMLDRFALTESEINFLSLTDGLGSMSLRSYVQPLQKSAS